MLVSEIHRYPVKSMLGESLTTATFDDNGLVGDRGHAVVDVETGAVASAKVPRLWARLLACSAAYVDEPVAGEPLPPARVTLPDGRILRTDQPGIAGALSELVGRPVEVTTSVPEGAVFEEFWPVIDGLAPEKFIAATTARHDESGEAVSRIDLGLFAPGTFLDLSPVHLLATATLRHLQQLAPESTFDARRYRPNLLLDGGDPDGFAENDWPGQDLKAGTLGLRISMATMRCVMTTLAQADLPVDASTLRTLAQHNRVEIPGLGTWACVGAYADVSQAGVVSTGDQVTLGA